MQLSTIQLRGLLGISSSSGHLAIVPRGTCNMPSKHSWSRQSLKHKMAGHVHQKKSLYHCIFPQRLSPRQTKVAEETKEPSVAYEEGCDYIDSKTSLLSSHMKTLLSRSFTLKTAESKGTGLKQEGLMKEVKHCPEKIFRCSELRQPPDQESTAYSSFNISTQWGKFCMVKKKKRKKIN